MAINAYGRHTHAACHNRDQRTVWRFASKSQDTADARNEFRVFQVGFGNPFGTFGIAWHQDHFGEVAILSFDMRCRHSVSPLFTIKGYFIASSKISKRIPL